MIVFLPFLITMFGFWDNMTWDTWLALGIVISASSYLIRVGADYSPKTGVQND